MPESRLFQFEHIAEARKKGEKWEAVLLEAGLSANGNYYDPERLEEWAPLFEEAPVCTFKFKGGEFHHLPDPHFQQQHKMVENVVGYVEDVKVETRDGKKVLLGTIRLVDDDFAERLRKLEEAGVKLFGLSINILGASRPGVMNGQRVNYVEEIEKVVSIDVVTRPAAGGKFLRMVAELEGEKVAEELKEVQDKLIEWGYLSEEEADVGTVLDILKSAVDLMQLRKAMREKEENAKLVLGRIILLIKNNKKDEAIKALKDFIANMDKYAYPAPKKQGEGDAMKADEKEKKTRTKEEELLNELRLEKCRLILDRRLAEAKLPEKVTKVIREAFENRIFEESELEARIAVAKAALETAPSVQVIKEEGQKKLQMLDDFFEGKFPSFRRLYEELTGDRLVTGRFTEEVKEHMRRLRIAEEIKSDTFSNLFADALHKKMVAEYKRADFGNWRVLGTVTAVSDFRQQKRLRVGGLGDLATVGEGAAYQEFSTPNDEKAYYTPSKHGNLYALTLEAIANDDVGYIRRIPTAMARAAARTLAKDIFVNNLQSNPTCTYDSTALFHSNHGNIGSTALSAASLKAAIIAIRKQTEKDSGERLGLMPKYLVVPPDLEWTARELLKAEKMKGSTDEPDINVLRGVLDLIVVPVLTDTDNWYVFCDPKDCPTFEVGFYNGKDEPEIFVADQPTVGSMFTADKITYKIRFIWGVGWIDHRGVYGAIV